MARRLFALDPVTGVLSTRVKLDRELELCRVYWSVLGDDKDRKLNEEMLEHATPYVRRGVAMAGSDIPYVNGALDKLIEVLTDDRDARLADHQMEIFSPQ